jgi:hypothetical protein
MISAPGPKADIHDQYAQNNGPDASHVGAIQDHPAGYIRLAVRSFSITALD